VNKWRWIDEASLLLLHVLNKYKASDEEETWFKMWCLKPFLFLLPIPYHSSHEPFSCKAFFLVKQDFSRIPRQDMKMTTERERKESSALTSWAAIILSEWRTNSKKRLPWDLVIDMKGHPNNPTATFKQIINWRWQWLKCDHFSCLSHYYCNIIIIVIIVIIMYTRLLNNKNVKCLFSQTRLRRGL